MLDRNVEYALRWLEKARHDIVTADKTLELETGPTDTPCFHAQQAIEESLKAVLTAHGVSAPRTHDLLLLLDKAAPLLPHADRWRETLAEISDYGVAVRYPADWPEPDRKDALAALAAARQVLEVAKQHLAAMPDDS